MNVDSAMLEQYRQNPATAEQDGLVVCLECGVLVRRLTRTPRHHARRIHGLDAATYLAKWPGAPLSSPDAVTAERDAAKLYKKIHSDELKATRREYNQRPEVRTHENEKKRERWPKYYAEHREKELARGKAKHQRFREKDNAREQRRYQDNIEERRATNREKQAAMRQRARLHPADWNEKPIEWRIIGSELLAKGYMSNEELAARLDASRILTCPSHYGENWKSAVKEESCVKFINRIRGWVKRPGRVAESKLAVN